MSLKILLLLWTMKQKLQFAGEEEKTNLISPDFPCSRAMEVMYPANQINVTLLRLCKVWVVSLFLFREQSMHVWINLWYHRLLKNHEVVRIKSNIPLWDFGIKMWSIKWIYLIILLRYRSYIPPLMALLCYQWAICFFFFFRQLNSFHLQDIPQQDSRDPHWIQKIFITMREKDKRGCSKNLGLHPAKSINEWPSSIYLSAFYVRVLILGCLICCILLL